MTWHKKSGTGASVKTPHVSVPKPAMPKAHKAPAQHTAKAHKTSNQKTAIYAAKPMGKKK